MLTRLLLFGSLWIILAAVLYRSMVNRTDGSLAVVMPVHTISDMDLWKSKPSISELRLKLSKSGCFKTVTVKSITINPQFDYHPLGPSIMFFNTFATPQIMLHNEWMLWMEPDVFVCQNKADPWGTILSLTMANNNKWMIGGMMQSHSDPLAPFFSFSEHINGNALYNLRSDAFLDFLEQVQEEFKLEAKTRFLDSFDVAIYQVARWTDGFWRWARIRHNFVYSNVIQNWYASGDNATIVDICGDLDTLLVHKKQY